MTDLQGNGIPMKTSAALYDRYRTDSVATMSPGRMVCALYDRLPLRPRPSVPAALVHAQDILEALHDSLDVTMWPAGAPLADLYLFLGGELVAANVDKDARRVAACREIVAPLRDAWHEAAGVPDGDKVA